MSGSKHHKRYKRRQPKRFFIAVAGLLLALFVATYFTTRYVSGNFLNKNQNTSVSSANLTTSPNNTKTNLNLLEREVLPAQGFVLPAKWGDSVKKLVLAGALNTSFLIHSLQRTGQPLTTEEKRILNGTSNENITINANDSVFVLDVLWAIGINNNNTIINKGPISTYSNASSVFASTGGYGPLGHLQMGALNLVELSSAEQVVANYTAENSYRPCCGNPTMFPDCNHGAAALGLIEIMASQGANTTQIFNALKGFNSFEFPQQYLNVAIYLQSKGLSFSSTPASSIMSANMSSSSGAASIQSYINSKGLNQQRNGGNGCGA